LTTGQDEIQLAGIPAAGVPVLTWSRGPERRFAGDTCVHRAFATQAALTPSRPAAQFGDRMMTYAGLDDRSGRLAACLRRLGAAPGVTIGLCAERSFEMLVGMLGIFKCGGICLPLDLSYPSEWVDFVLADACCDYILTYGGLTYGGGWQRRRSPRARVIALEKTDWMECVPTNAGAEVPESVIYVVYTSGSTGRPKGVMVSHRPLMNIIRAHRELMPTPAQPRTLQFASINFDVSFHETFFTWLSGGTVFLISDEDRKQPRRLLNVIDAHEIDTLFLPPSMLRLVAESIVGIDPPSSLRNIVVSGERLEITPALREWHLRHPRLEIHNHYGSNESHVVTVAKLAGSEAEWPVFPLAGRPVANAAIYVLDEDMSLQPVGAPGEAYLGGAGVAVGYLNRADLTAERFVADPFGAAGARLYKSGDAVRWKPGGDLEFLGRTDFQIKIRGYRVEPGEIEAVLLTHPEVSHAVVTARVDSSDETYLVAYVVGRANSTFDAHDLRAYMKRCLPDYMIPVACMRLDALPLNPNGKIDRGKLPAPDDSAYVVSAFDPPLTPKEAVIAALWADVLGLQRVGRNDNFFDLGGNSLKAVRMLARLRQKLHDSVTLGTLLHHPTPARLAAILEQPPCNRYR
jgi:amino acid adenylation domain-containing protein